MSKKYVFEFGGGKADGKAGMKELLGGKGANLAEMANLGIPVPPGFTITTEVCNCYYEHNKKYPPELETEVRQALANVEVIMDAKFGDPENPLLLSVRSGARSSMPGMMETVLNIGLNEKTIKGLVAKTGNERFAYDAYRRLIMMYSDVVMEKAAGIETKEGKGVRVQLEHAMEAARRELQLAHGGAHQGATGVVELAELAHLGRAHLGVAGDGGWGIRPVFRLG